jgi:two-component system, chemotaxis family, CheB/CheR fusion protein
MSEEQSEPSSPVLSASYVVGIGASAGGLEALEAFFDQVPKSSGMAFVLVQHLSPDFKSMMDELLARHTELPIHLVEDGMQVEADHVYLIPPSKEMIISGGRLLLSDRDPQQELSLPIDVFFRSLAQDCGPRGIAIVLSGGGSDGSRGIVDVHEAGGLVIVQDSASAQFDGMPKSAFDAGIADWVLSPGEMPKALLNYAKGIEPPASATRAPALHGMDAVYQMLEDEYGIDFTHYKPSTVTRRIERRLRLARAEDIDEYIKRLRAERDELDALYRDLLIGVTRFFRDDQAFELLRQRILPDLLHRGRRDVELRVWVAGCATGEEAYSLAILLHELLLHFGGRPIKIFATDVHRGSLDLASRGFYDEQSVANVSRERLERYFSHHGRGYQVVPEIRQTVVFAPHNVMTDAPFTRVDLISCRNLLIYLEPTVQQRIIGLFHFALNRDGVLFLGPSETAGALSPEFETVDSGWRIYKKRGDLRAPSTRPAMARATAPVHRTEAPLLSSGRYSVSQLLGTYDALLEELMPSALLVTDRGELAHVFGGASRFLKPRGDGRQGLDLLEAVDGPLKTVLVAGLARALRDPQKVVFNGVTLPCDGGNAPHTISLRSVRSKNGGPQHVLINFEAMEGRAGQPEHPPTEVDLQQIPSEQIGALESELSYTKESLHAAIEELETSNEELQAANEELVASNEELQSTNEELQSVNEELYTVNAEYQRKIAELTELTNDMNNLLASTDIGTIFLDHELKIRKLTPQIEQTFNVLPQDLGRPIDAFTHNMLHPGLVADLQQVLATGDPIERELRDRTGKSFFLRVLPYRAKGVIDGVVLTLIDVSGLKAAEDALFHERYLFNSLLASVPDAIYFKDATGRIIRANDAMAKRLGLSAANEAVGKSLFELRDRDAALTLSKEDDTVLKTGEAQLYRLEKSTRTDGAEQWDLVTRLPLRDPDGRTVGTFGVFHDVTEQKQAEQKIHDAVERRDQFLAMLSHELRNPLAAVVTTLTLLRKQSHDELASGKALDIIERQSQQMARLLDDLLDVSRVTQNKIELKRQIVDLRVVAKDACDAVRELMKSRGLDFSVEFDPRPLYVHGDIARLLQIQINLLHNAAKYTPRGGNVLLRAKLETDAVVIVVRDNGAGIAKDMLDNVFDLFVQSKRTLDRSEGGLGVGLTLVRGLVDMHGGTVTAQSDGEGKGSEFVVRLPFADSIDAAPIHPRPSFRLPRGAMVVVVEDNEDNRQTLCELLELAGFRCRSAGDGVSALALIGEARPDAAVIDIGLPGMDGLELARRLRDQPERARMYLVALSGYGQPSDRMNALRAGFDEHLVKPVNSDRLLALLGGVSPEEETPAMH